MNSNEHTQKEEANEFNRRWYPELLVCHCQQCEDRRCNLHDLEQHEKALELSVEIREELKECMLDGNYPFNGYFE